MDVLELEEWRAADRLFVQLIDLDPDHLARRLAALDAPAGIRRKLDVLLCRAGESHPLLDVEGGLLRASARLAGEDPMLGRCLGDWRLQELLGCGGMAAVYRAERIGGDYRQQAAVKVLSLVLRGPDDHARFRRERRILAQLQHPHIARLLDGGIAADGTPFLAMSLVEGERIDAWCERQQLDLAARVRLMLQVCGAVAHANRLLVVHRDIKPANILVDREGSACLLDFGIARLLEGDTTGDATLTRAFTPDYAAPEQRVGAAPLSTAVDVYGLGAVLYRLMTGQAPRHDADGKLIPASRLASDTGQPALSRALRGDLDAILSHALENDPRARYAGADALASDLESWLHHRPLRARRAGVIGRAVRLVRRNPAASALAALCLMLTVGGGVAVLTSQLRVREQARELQAVVDFQSSLLRSFDPERVGAGIHDALDGALADAGLEPGLRRRTLANIDVAGLAVDNLDRAWLQRAVEAVRLTLADQPRVRARLLQSLASHYIDLGRLEHAARLQDEALVLFREHFGLDDPETLASLREEIDLGLRSGTIPEEAAVRGMLAQHVRYLGADSYPTALARALLARWHMESGRLNEAELELRAAVARMEALRGPEDLDVVGEQAALGQVLLNAHRDAEAADLLRKALAAARRVHASHSPKVLSILGNLATALSRLGRLDEAETMHAEAFHAYRTSLGEQHPRTLIALNNLAADARKRGDYAAALPLQEQASAGMEQAMGPDHPLALRLRMNLGEVWLGLGRAELAAESLDQALANWWRLGHVDVPAIARAQRLLAEAQLALGDPARASASLQAAWDTAVATGSADEQRAAVEAWLALDAALPQAETERALWQQRQAALDRPKPQAGAGVGADVPSSPIAPLPRTISRTSINRGVLQGFASDTWMQLPALVWVRR